MEYQAIETTGAISACPSFTVERESILPILELFARHIIERRSSIPILDNIRIDASPTGELRITGTDLDLQMSATLPADIETPGATTVSAFLIRDIVKKAAKQSQVWFRAGDGRAKISAGRADQSIQTLPVENYPTILVKPDFTLSAEFDAVQLADDIARVVPAISKEETRYYLNGINVTIENGLLCFAATDGHRLSLIERDAAAVIDTGFNGGIMPRKAVGVMQAILKARGDKTVSLDMTASKFVLDAGDIVLTSKLIDGTFPDYRRVIPNARDLRGTLSVQSTELLGHCKAAQGQDGKVKPLKLEMVNGAIMAGIAGPDGFARALSAEFDGQDCGLSFNSTYMMPFASANDALTFQTSAFDGDKIAGGPILIKSPDAPQWTGVLMPTRCDVDLPKPRAVTYPSIQPAPGQAADLFGVHSFGDKFATGKAGPRVATDKECMAYLLDYAKRLGLPDLGHARLVSGADVPKGLTVGEIEQERTEYPETWSSMRRAYTQDFSKPTKIEARYADGAYSIPMPGRNQSPVTVQYADDTGEYGEPMPCTDEKGRIALPDQPKGRAKAKGKAAQVAKPIIQDDGGFGKRVDYAAAVISQRRETSRAFDSCFENYDGDAVVYALIQRAKNNENLAANLPRYIAATSLAELDGKFDGMNLADVARGLRARHDTPITQPAPDAPLADELVKQRSCHYHAGLKDKAAGKPRELPSYFIAGPNHFNARDWFAGWDDGDAPQDAQEQQDDEPATYVADEPEITPQDQKNGLADDIDAQPDAMAALLARMDALERHLERVAIAPSVGIADYTPISGKQRSPAHVRAIMAYLKQRKERSDWQAIAEQHTARIDRLTVEVEQANELTKRAYDKRDEARREVDRLDTALDDMAAKRRRSVLKAREIMQRLCAEHRLVDKLTTAKRELAQDIFDIKGEREAAIAESERLRKVAYQQAGHIQTVAERLDRAEAILRAQGPALSIVPPISLAVAA